LIPYNQTGVVQNRKFVLWCASPEWGLHVPMRRWRAAPPPHGPDVASLVLDRRQANDLCAQYAGH
jgi:hypothetical protein